MIRPHRIASRICPRTALLGLGISAGIVSLTSLLAGCGGSNSSPSSIGSNTRAASLSVYVTDGFSDQYHQVLVTVYGIDISTDNGATWTTVYTNTAGQTIDLASLSSTAQLLSTVSVPATTITNARLTFGNSVTLGSGANTQTVTLDPTAPNTTVSGNMVTITLATPTTMHPGKLSTLALDFKLAGFQLVHGALRPSIVPADPIALQGKQKIAHIPGTIASLTATGFTLTCPGSSSAATPIAVTTTSTTTIASGTATPANSTGTTTTTPATLAVGDAVIVEGTVDATTGVVTAQDVLIVPSGTTGSDPFSPPSTQPGPFQPGSTLGSPGESHVPAGEISAVGSIQSVTTDGSNQFTLQVREGERFPTPMGGFTVQTNASTVFQSGNTTATFSSLAANTQVAVVGTFDATTGNLTAQYVILLPASPASTATPPPSPVGM